MGISRFNNLKIIINYKIWTDAMLYVCRRLVYSDGGFVLKLLLNKPGRLNCIIGPGQSFATYDFNILRKIFNKEAFTGPAVVLLILPFVLVIYI
jgi:hypothetical protein